jgi:hypothetical protein
MREQNRQLGEPFAAVRQPPTESEKRNRGANGPPEWQKQIGRKTQNRESPPEDLALHGSSLTELLSASQLASVSPDRRGKQP